MTKNRGSNRLKLKNYGEQNHAKIRKKSGQNNLTETKNHRKNSTASGDEILVQKPREREVHNTQEVSESKGGFLRAISARLDMWLSPFGKDVFAVDTISQAPLLNGLMKVTKVENVVFKDGVLTFSAPQKHRAQIIALINNLCYNHTIVSTKSIPLAIFSVLKRTGLVIGLFCAVCVFCLYNSFILQVQVVGEVGNDVMDVLAHNRVIEGVYAPAFDGDKVERELLALDGVAFASVEKLGTRVYVRVVGELAPDAYVDVGERDMSASFDGVVTRVIVFSGTAEVSVGDRVTAGQTLIGGYYLKGEDKIPVNPAGEVYAERVVVVERFFPDQYMAYSGRSKTITRLGIFGKMKSPSSPYQDYAIKRETTKNDFLVPYVVSKWTYYEVCLAENNLSDDEMMALAYGEVISAGNFERVTSYTTSIEDAVGGRLVKIVLTVEEKL